MKYTIFEGKREVEINDKIVELYERYSGLLNAFYVQHLLTCEGLNETSPQEVLNKTLKEMLFEELTVLSRIPEDMEKLFNEGIFQ